MHLIASDCSFTPYSENFDILAEPSPVPESVLNSFQPLEWNISSEVANDIKLAIDWTGN